MTALLPSRHAGLRSGIYVLRKSESEIPYKVCQEGEEGNFKPCLIEDEGGPLEAVMQVEASNHRKLLW